MIHRLALDLTACRTVQSVWLIAPCDPQDSVRDEPDGRITVRAEVVRLTVLRFRTHEGDVSPNRIVDEQEVPLHRTVISERDLLPAEDVTHEARNQALPVHVPWAVQIRAPSRHGWESVGLVVGRRDEVRTGLRHIVRMLAGQPVA